MGAFSGLGFAIDGRRFAIDVAGVITVLPVPPLRALDHVPAWVAGLIRFHGQLTPVIDLCRIHAGRPARPTLGTRLVVVRYAAAGGDRTLALIAEDVIDMVTLDDEHLQPAGIEAADAPWLGPLGPTSTGELVQVVRIESLLPDDVRAILFRAAAPPC
jgi:chemotaxis-related protein WspB